MKVLFLGYRSWSKEAIEKVVSHPKIENYLICQSKKDFEVVDLEKFDLLVTLGWSEELGEGICSKIKAIGLHCAELDRYSYGTPIQLQIIDGIVKTKHRIFPFIYDPTSNRAHTHTREYSHEMDLYLHGGMEDIFYQLTATSIALLNAFFDDYPNIVFKKWPEESITRAKRVPEDSKLEREDFRNYSTKYLYNLIRSLGSPYPNAYVEDEFGTLYFERVRYRKK
jgi:methionyl-tRNA formyltransferase